MLEYSGISDYTVYDMIIFADDDILKAKEVRSKGTKLFKYVYFGSRFEDSDEFINNLKATVLEYKEQGIADGIFWDECEVGYWDISYYDNPEKAAIFRSRLKEICDYCTIIGLETVVNGVRAYMDVGDYWMWESFMGYWNNNKLLWHSGSNEREVLSDGAVTYKENLSNWNLTGSLSYNGTSIINGSNGTMDIIIDMNSIVNDSEKKEQYEWVYFEWFGLGADDNTCEIYAWTGESLPFNEATWTLLPKLWKGEPESWNGINKKSKYLKIEIRLNGASDFRLDTCFIAYGYNYPYFDMTESNPLIDINPERWNYNTAHLENILEKQNLFRKDSLKNPSVRVLCHSYGLYDDYEKMKYMFIGHKIWDFYSWDYTHPLHQKIDYTDILDDPFGRLVKYEDRGNGVYYGEFTGCTAEIDVKNNTYTLNRNEPSYWYNRAINLDGTMADWSDNDRLYSNLDDVTFHIYPLNINIDPSTGTHDNTKVVDGRIELASDGTGTWTSDIIETPNFRKSRVTSVSWDGGTGYSGGEVELQIRYKLHEGTFTEWHAVGKSSTPNYDFTAIQLRVYLSGRESAEDYVDWPQADGSYIREYFYRQEVSFWGGFLYYKIILKENLNIRNFYMTDDNLYLYFRFDVNDTIDFYGENAPRYNIYLMTNTENTGYIGDWFQTSFGADYLITNGGLFKWDENFSDRTSFEGFKWVGTSVVKYSISEDGKSIEYGIKKSVLGNIPSSVIKVYMHVEESNTSYSGLVDGSNLDASVYPIEFTGYKNYSQKMQNLKCPHGYYASEEIYVNAPNGITITYSKYEPANTNINVWLRTKGDDGVFSEWLLVSNGYKSTEDIKWAQYMIGLNTTNGIDAPSVSDVRISINE